MKVKVSSESVLEDISSVRTDLQSSLDRELTQIAALRAKAMGVRYQLSAPSDDGGEVFDAQFHAIDVIDEAERSIISAEDRLLAALIKLPAEHLVEAAFVLELGKFVEAMALAVERHVALAREAAERELESLQDGARQSVSPVSAARAVAIDSDFAQRFDRLEIEMHEIIQRIRALFERAN